MFKTSTEPVMFKSEATDRYWGCGGMSAKSSAAPPQPLSEWDAPTEKVHNAISCRLIVINTLTLNTDAGRNIVGTAHTYIVWRE